jgi:DNA recombination protein RmuC
MAIENPALLAVLALVATAVIVVGLVLLRRPARAVAGPDPTVLLLQQEIGRLAGQVAQIGSQVPRDVGASLQQITGQMSQRLSENAQSLQKASADTGRLIADINHRLGELGRGSQEILSLGQDIRALQQIFQAPKIRGGLGEIALASLLQQTFPAEHFTLQHTFRDGQTVDAVLRMPGGMVPIDSKFPLAGFRQMLDASGPDQKDRARRQFAREVRKHIDDIADKYVRPTEGTLDMALMYIPAENIFYELITRFEAAGEEDISAYALKRRVIPVSPNSIYAYLQAVAYGFMGLRIEQRAREILKGLQQLNGDFVIFGDSFKKAQRHLLNAQSAFVEAGEHAGRLGDKLQQFASLAEGPAHDEALPPGTVHAENRFQARGMEQ